ncbi:hypothetical protein AMECASPLE_017978 [Ameca splendens]|uniref:BED-type domain-containing protein n=1 Tax=Ameca splendens TaxID=208324 RepID=A0ABV0ZBF6_9TELE
MVALEGKMALSKWKYKHYFILLEVKAKDGCVKCTLCPSVKCSSTSIKSNCNLMYHLSMAHSSTEQVAKNTIVDTVHNNNSRPGLANVSPANKQEHEATPPKQPKLYFFTQTSKKTCDTE